MRFARSSSRRARRLRLPARPTAELMARTLQEAASAADGASDVVRLADVLDHSPSMVAVTDRDGRFVWVNRHFCLLAGVAREQLVGQGWADVLPEGFAAEMRELEERVARTAAPDESQVCLERGGTERTLSLTAFPLLDDSGEVYAVAALLTDVTERRLVEEALRQSEERFREVFEHGPVGQLVIDTSGRIRQANPAFCRLLGFPAAHILDGSIHQLVHPADRVESQMALAAALEGVAPPLTTTTSSTGAERGLELRLMRRGGSVVWCRTSYSAVHGADGEPAYIVGMLEDVTGRRRAEDELEHRAQHDTLTGLPNRALLAKRLQAALDGANKDPRHTGEVTAVLFIDLDGFKEVNDSLGHEAGDELLRVVAVRLERALRPGDTLARFGGDEFVVCCPGMVSVDSANTVAERLLATLRTPIRVAEATVNIGASIGVAVCTGSERSTIAPSDLLRHADVALYAAKDAGRGRVAVFDPALRNASEQRRTVESELTSALREGGLVLCYQPLVNAARGNPVGAEALIRWDHPTRGRLTPEHFLLVAARAGLMPEVDRWVITTACAEAALWDLLPDGSIPTLALNVAPGQCADGSVVDFVLEGCEMSGLDPSRIVIEMTETALVERPKATAAALDRLRSLGVKVALDDFGTGYSSLSHLRELPVDQVKIDRSFIRSLPASPRDAAIVAATVNLAQALGAEVVAEGIETVEHWHAAIDAGCTMVQGYLFAQPTPNPTLWSEVHVPPQRPAPPSSRPVDSYAPRPRGVLRG